MKERVFKNWRTTAIGGTGGAISAATMFLGFGVTDWRVLAGAAAVGLVTGAVFKDPDWLKKRATNVISNIKV